MDFHRVGENISNKKLLKNVNINKDFVFSCEPLKHSEQVIPGRLEAIY